MNIKEEVKYISPNHVGWLEYKLKTKEMDYVWRCISNKKHNLKNTLAGNITASNALLDRGDWFFTTVILPLINAYCDRFVNLGEAVPIALHHPYYMPEWWVNYQKQNEFNPFHKHTGVYSFVIWMKIPYDSRKLNRKDIARNSTNPKIGEFQFVYKDIIGGSRTYEYPMSPEAEGTMLFFPSQLDHLVYPFYDCDEERISVSGNIMSDTSRKF